MNKPLLNDKEIYPDNEVIKKYLFDTFDLWMKFIDILRNDYPDYNTEWRYYNDGKSWLFKVTHKKKTICWVSVWGGFFKTTFYFNNKADEIIKCSQLDEIIKSEYFQRETKGKIKPISIDLKSEKDLDIVKQLTEIKNILK